MNPILSVRQVSKRFGNVQALSGVDFNARAGEVHALLGENGAGKSTLTGILAGFVTPDSGSGELAGSPLAFGDPVRIRQGGVEMVHQHFLLVPNFLVEENLALATVGHLGRAADVEKAARSAFQTAEDLGWKIDGKARTGELPVGVQQRIEILKALSGNARVLILDEPTAVLSPDEVEDLMSVLRKLRESGTAIVLIAHKLSEVVGIADRVTVLRKGKFVATSVMAETNADQMAEWMVGESVQSVAPGATSDGPVVLRTNSLHVKGDRRQEAVRGVSFELRRGEILGIGGVDGNGQLELAEALAGVRQPNGGSIQWLGEGRPRTGYIPQDRQSDGLALSMSVLENMCVAGLDDPGLTFGPFLRLKAMRAWGTSLIERFEVKTPTPDLLVEDLSGGNQQKVVVARTLARRPDLLVAANPTRGLDIRATVYVHRRIVEAAALGTAVVLVSTDLDELRALAHRTVYLSRGKFVDHIVGSDL